MAAPAIPLAYQLLFLYFEPFMAFMGTVLLFRQPATFLNTMTPTVTFAPSHQIIFEQLGGTYALFAWNEAIVLRVAGTRQQAATVKIWKAMLLGILVCDAIHLYGSWAALGGAIFWNPTLWRKEDWVNLGSLWGQGVVRIAFLLDIGLKRESKGAKDQ